MYIGFTWWISAHAVTKFRCLQFYFYFFIIYFVKGISSCIYRIVLEECTAPLGPFLRRMAKVSAPNPLINSESNAESNPTEVYLK